MPSRRARYPQSRSSAPRVMARTALGSPPSIQHLPASTRTTSSARWKNTRRVAGRTRSWLVWLRRSRTRTWPSLLTTSASRSHRWRQRADRTPASAGNQAVSRSVWLLGGLQLVEKHRHGLEVDVLVGFLAEAMSLILRGKVPD